MTATRGAPKPGRRRRTGIETPYAGYTMRSRNEARWAAFFDQLGWEWEYEPFDANGYIPDFVLTGERPVLVEVKPELNIEELRCHEAKVRRGLQGLWSHDVLIVGSVVSPYIHPDERFWKRPVIGVLLEWISPEYLPEECTPWIGGVGHWCLCTTCGQPSFFHGTADYTARVCGHSDSGRNCGDFPLRDIKRYWAAASDTTRWRP